MADKPDFAAAEKAIREWLDKHKPWLVIFDNVDTQKAAEDVMSAQQGLGDGRVLITSKLSGLWNADHCFELSFLDKVGGGQFLRANTPKRRRPPAPNEDTDTQEAEALAEELGGLFLALKMVAKHINRNRLRISDYRKAWQSADVPPWFDGKSDDHPGLAKTYEITWNELEKSKLGTDLRVLIQILANLAPGQTLSLKLLEDAEHSLSGILHGKLYGLLVALNEYSMVQFEEESESISIHSVVRRFVISRMQEAERRKSLEAALKLIDACSPVDFETPQKQKLWEQLLPHIKAVTEEGEKLGIAKPTCRLLNDMGVHLSYQNETAVTADYYRRALALMDKSDDVGVHDPLRITYYCNLASVCEAEADRCYEEALKISRLHLDKEVDKDLADEFLTLAERLHVRLQYEAAKEFYDKVMDFWECRENEDELRVARLLNDLGLWHSAQGDYEKAVDFVKRALGIREKHSQDKPTDLALSLQNLAEIYILQRKYAEAEPHCRRALVFRLNNLRPDHADIGVSSYTVAECLRLTGKYADAEKLYMDALTIHTNRGSMASSEHGLALLYHATQRYGEARLCYEKALPSYREVESPSGANVARCLFELGEICKLLGDRKQAEIYQEQSLQILQERIISMEPDHPNLAVSCYTKAEYLRQMGKFEDAESFYEQALGLYKDGASIGMCERGLAMLYSAAKRYPEAEMHYRRAVNVYRKVEVPPGDNAARCFSELGEVSRLLGNFDDAETHQKGALEILGDRETIQVAQALNNLSLVYHATARTSDAIALAKRAEKIYRSILGNNSPELAQVLVNMGIMFHDLRDYAKAEPIYREALRIREEKFGHEHTLYAQCLFLLAELHRFQRQFQEALPYYQQVRAIWDKAPGADRFSVYQTWFSEAMALSGLNRDNEAEPLLNKVLELSLQLPDTADKATRYYQIAEWLRIRRRYPEAETRYEKAIQVYESIKGPEHISCAPSLYSLGLNFHNQKKYSLAQSHYERALKIYESADGSDRRTEIALIYNNLGVLFDDQQQYDRSEGFYERALRIREEFLPPDHLDIAASCYGLGACRRKQGKPEKYADAEELLLRALEIREKGPGTDPNLIALSLNALGLVYGVQQKDDQAREYYHRALVAYEKIRDPYHTDILVSLSNLLSIYSHREDFATAEPLYKRVLEVQRKLKGEDSPDTAKAYFDLGNCLVRQARMEKYAEAEVPLLRALEIYEKNSDSDPILIALCLNTLGLAYSPQDKNAEAQKYFERALSAYEKLRETNHADVRVSLHNLAGVYHRQRKDALAEPLYQRIVSIQEKVKGHEHEDTALAYFKLGDCRRLQGKNAEAEAPLLRALEIREKNLNSDPDLIALSLNALGLIYDAQKKDELAKLYYERALAAYEKIRDAYHNDVRVSLQNLADFYRQMKAHASAETLYKRVVDIQEKTKGSEHQATATAYFDYGECLRFQNKFLEAIACYLRALPIREKGDNEALTGQCCNALGLAQESSGKLEEARMHFEEAVRRYKNKNKAAQRPDDKNVAVCLENLARVVSNQGKLTQALEQFREALAIRAAESGPAHSDLIGPLQSVANTLKLLKEYAEADELYRKALDIARKTGDHGQVSNGLNYVAINLHVQGKTKEAIPLVVEALDIRDRNKLSDVALLISNLAIMYSDIKEHAKAEPYWRRLLAIEETQQEKTNLHQTVFDLAECLRFQKKYADAEGFYRRALEIREHTLGKEHSLVGQTLNSMGLVCSAQGKNNEAASHYESAIAVYKKARGERDINVATCLDNLGSLHLDQGDFDAAAAAFQRELAILEKLHGQQDAAIVTTLYYLAACHMRPGHYTKAEEFLQHILQIEEKAKRPDHLDVGQVVFRIGQCFRLEDRYAEALPLYERALAIYEKSLTPNDPAVARILNYLGLTHHGLNQFDEARINYEKALAIYEKGSSVVDTFTVLSNIGLLFKENRRYWEAIPYYRGAVKLLERTPNSDDTELARSCYSLGECVRLSGQLDEALDVHQKALAIRKKLFGPRNSYTAQSFNCLGLVYSSLEGQELNAVASFKEAIAIYDEISPDSLNVAVCQENLADLFSRLGQFEDATALLNRVVTIREKAPVPDMLRLADCLDKLASAYQALRTSDVALPFSYRSLAIREKIWGSDSENLANAIYQLARSYHTFLRRDEVRSLYERAMAIWKKIPNTDPYNIPTFTYHLGVLAHEHGDYVNAVRLYQEALTAFEKFLPADSQDIIITRASYNSLLNDIEAGKPLLWRWLRRLWKKLI